MPGNVREEEITEQIKGELKSVSLPNRFELPYRQAAAFRRVQKTLGITT
jgi:hypothetical protein